MTSPTTPTSAVPGHESSDRIVWIDCEMTGLDLGADALVEVAAVVTDSELRVLGGGVSGRTTRRRGSSRRRRSRARR